MVRLPCASISSVSIPDASLCISLFTKKVEVLLFFNYHRGGFCAILGQEGSRWVHLGQGGVDLAINSNLEGLMSILGAAQATRVVSPARNNSEQNENAAVNGIGNDETTLSSIGSSVLMSASGADVRASKIADIQVAIASGSYNVPAQVLASRLVDSMLGATTSSCVS